MALAPISEEESVIHTFNGPYIPYRSNDEISEIERKWTASLEDDEKFNFRNQSDPNYLSMHRRALHSV